MTTVAINVKIFRLSSRTTAVCCYRRLQPQREKQPYMTNGDNARVTGRPLTPNPEVQTVKPNERILWINGVDLCIRTFDSARMHSSLTRPRTHINTYQPRPFWLDRFDFAWLKVNVHEDCTVACATQSRGGRA